MTTPAVTHKRGKTPSWHRLAGILLCGSFLTATGHVQAQGFGSPDECRDYRGDAHVTCLYAYIEMQQNKLAQIEDAIHRRTDTEEETRQQAAIIEETFPPVTKPTQQPGYVYPPVAPGYAYAGYGYPGVPYGYPAYGTGLGLSLYPGLGLSLGFGGPGYYGRPFYAPRYIYRTPGFYGPRFSYGHRFYSGPRFQPGPRFYSSPRSFGPRSFGNRSFGHRRR
ncbi:MAG: hypothetical protein H0X47_13790 [Nitrospirales bacterium]|nr:hypothetical protein [Nitrospira sp.]MBA3966812.1 hypothetical protein [Nitrospirales bacterium]